MTSRRLSLTALSCALASAGCTQSFSSTQETSHTHLDQEGRVGPSSESRLAPAVSLRPHQRHSASSGLGLVERFWPENSRSQFSSASSTVIPSVPEESSSGRSPTVPASSHSSFRSASLTAHVQSQIEAQSQRFWTAGVDAGYAASVAEQTAVTDSDWNQVVSQWKTAITHLGQVSSDSPRFLKAQTKLAIYRSALERAEGRYIAVVQNRYMAKRLPEMSLPEGSAPETSAVENSLNLVSDELVGREPVRRDYEMEGQQVRRWIEVGNFEAVERLLQDAVKRDRRTRNGLDYADAVLVSAVSNNNVAFTAQVLQRLNQWVSQSPSSMAYSVRSYFTQAYLWEDIPLEVGHRPKKCPPTPEDLERLQISAQDVETALKLNPQNPVALTSKLRLTKLGLLNEGGNVFEETFQALNTVSPGSFQAHLEKASYLWSQDLRQDGQQVLSFLRQSVAQAPNNPALPMLLPVMHINIANMQENEREYLSQPDVWQEIQNRSEQVIAQLPSTASYPELFSQLAQRTGQRQLARRYQQIAMNRSAYLSGGQQVQSPRSYWPKVMMTLL